MWRYLVISGFLLAAMQPAAGDQAGSRSREIVYAYFDQPKAYATIKVNTTTLATEVEICTDVCDAFAARLPPDSPSLWDAIFLF
jgi:hypothetical protein